MNGALYCLGLQLVFTDLRVNLADSVTLPGYVCRPALSPAVSTNIAAYAPPRVTENDNIMKYKHGKHR